MSRSAILTQWLARFPFTTVPSKTKFSATTVVLNSRTHCPSTDVSQPRHVYESTVERDNMSRLLFAKAIARRRWEHDGARLEVR